MNKLREKFSYTYKLEVKQFIYLFIFPTMNNMMTLDLNKGIIETQPCTWQSHFVSPLAPTKYC